MQFKDKHSREKQKAKCKYIVKTTILGTDDDDEVMKYKQVLMIREPPVKLKEDVSEFEEQEIKTMCCISQGVSSLKTSFEKNIYIPTETAKAILTVDNSKCSVGIKEITFAIEQ